MKHHFSTLTFFIMVLSILPSSMALSNDQNPEITLLTEPQLWQVLEFEIAGVPTVSNPFDPEEITVDAIFTSPSDQSLRVPAFWYQAYSRENIEGSEKLTAEGAPQWRIRYTPTETGKYSLSLKIKQNGKTVPCSSMLEITVPDKSMDQQHGWVQLADQRYFQTSDGNPLRLIGENVCWDVGRGTYEYDDWLKAMAESGQNFARLWFSPWSIGIEHHPDTLNNYSLDDAWQLDYIFSLAEHYGIYLMICFDHHGMYQTNETTWGGTNAFWNTNNPYSTTLGGPCAKPNDFFSLPEARTLYQKRLRYLIARYGYSPNLHSWQFFNEIDNVFPREKLDEAMVYDWHAVMGRWLKEQDPFKHLVSTSLTGGSDRPEVWTLPEMDFSVYHSYYDPAPAKTIALVSKSFVERYKKPIMIGEFGTHARGLNIKEDPHMRGFRQGLWGGVAGGSTGTAMSWWWEVIDAENLYPIYDAMSSILDEAGWQTGQWAPIDFPINTPPIQLAEAIPNAQPFTADLALDSYRGIRLPGKIAISSPLSAKRSSETLQNFLRSTEDPLNPPISIQAHFATEAKINLQVNSVEGSCNLKIQVDGDLILEQDLRSNGDYNQTFSASIPEGLHTIELLNTGEGQIYLDSIQLERVRPSQYTGQWEFVPDALGLRGEGRAIVYLVSQHVVFPAHAHRLNPPVVENYQLQIPEWPKGEYLVKWYTPADGSLIKVDKLHVDDDIDITAPSFNEDLVAVILPKS